MTRRDPESGTTPVEKPAGALRSGIGRGFTFVEDAVYLAFGCGGRFATGSRESASLRKSPRQAQIGPSRIL